MTSVLRRALRPALCIIVAGCATSGSGGTSSNNAAIPQRRTDRTVISADEIASNHDTNLYDLVRSLRVEWLTSRGAAAANPGMLSANGGGGRSRGSSAANSGMASTPLQVYLNRQKVGTVDELKNMSPVGVASLKYYSPTEAQAMFGEDNASGAIQVIPVAGGAKPE